MSTIHAPLVPKLPVDEIFDGFWMPDWIVFTGNISVFFFTSLAYKAALKHASGLKSPQLKKLTVFNFKEYLEVHPCP
jgi:hypothetical protein